jgi:hypothetical protein
MPISNPTPESQNYVLVNSVQDLPYPTGNVIQLEDNTTYEFNTGTIDLGDNRIVLGLSNTLKGQGNFQTFLTASALPSGEAFISVVGNTSVNIYLFQDFTIQQLPAGTQCFDIDSVGLFNLRSICVRITPFIGRINEVNGFVSDNLCQFQENEKGFEFSGTFYAIVFKDGNFQSSQTGDTFIKILAGTTIGFLVNLESITCIGNGTQTVLDIDPSVTFLFTQNAPVRLFTNQFLFVGTVLNGIALDSDLLEFKQNMNLQDTIINGSYYLTTPSANTIAVAGDYYKMEGNTTATDLRGFVHTDNRLTYNFEQPIKTKVSAHIYVLPTAADLPTISIAIAVNGTVVDSVKMSNTVSSAGAGVIVSTDLITNLVTNDYIEIFVSNETSTNSILATKANLTVIEI